MASLRSRAEHQQAASRRLELLTAELAAFRPAPDPPPEPAPPDDPWLAGHTRIRPLRAVPTPAPEPAAPMVPLPGRHAARRAVRPPTLVPEALRGRVSLGPSQLVVVAVLVAVGLAVTAWWVVRGEPERREAPGPALGGSTAPPLAGASPASSAAAGAAPSPAAAAATVTVDVTGRVRERGIVVLDVGSRVVDAIEAAGGARRGVDLSSLNLARVLVDGEQVVVGRPAVAAVAGGSTTGGAAASGALVNLNTATAAELDALPEVGPVTAEAILAWRSEHGGFSSVDELLEVDGIGDATLARIAPHVTV